MEREILAYIKQNRMIGKNDVVLAGVSGGSDSMAMLRILKELQGKLDFTLRVVHTSWNTWKGSGQGPKLCGKHMPEVADSMYCLLL